MATVIGTSSLLSSQAQERCMMPEYSVTLNGEKINYTTSLLGVASTSAFNRFRYEGQTLKVTKKDGVEFSIATEVCSTENPFQSYRSDFKIASMNIIKDGITNHFTPTDTDWANTSTRASETFNKYIKNLNQDITSKREKALKNL